MKPSERIIVALDVPDFDAAEKLLQQLQGVITYYKVGFEFFTAYGWKAVELVKKSGAKVFLDLKLHDIPNTVSKTASVICDHEVDMFNVHGLGGFEMMKKTADIVAEKSRGKKVKPLLIAVTILTSHSQESLTLDLGIPKKVEDQVLHLAALAEKAGLNGVVSSPQEIAALRKSIRKDFLIVTPGIRPAGSATQDQKRVLTPQDALKAGADYLVMGRPITAAADPKQAALSILKDLS